MLRELMDELIDAYLFNSDELSYILNIRTGEILLDGDEGITGEPSIDWDDDEETEDLIEIPQATSRESFKVMERFAEKQPPVISAKLIEVLKRRKPFRQFKDHIVELGVDEDFYSFQEEAAKVEILKWLDIEELNYDQLNQKFKQHHKMM